MRSKLFVPGSRPELFAKAMAAGADAVSFDLEDAVVPARKAEARAAVAAFLAGQPAGGPLRIVRVNGAESAEHAADLDAVVRPGLDVVNLPMVQGDDDIRRLADRLAALEAARGLPRLAILATIETPRAVRLAHEIAAAHPRVIGLQLGFGDLFAPLGIDPAHGDAVRLSVRLAAGETGVPVYDSAYPGVGDPQGFAAQARAARAAGLAGKSCVHPSQVAPANAIFFPTPAELARARAIVEAADRRFGEGTGAFLLDGAMIDGPYVDRARRLLTLADTAPA